MQRVRRVRRLQRLRELNVDVTLACKRVAVLRTQDDHLSHLSELATLHTHILADLPEQRVPIQIVVRHHVAQLQHTSWCRAEEGRPIDGRCCRLPGRIISSTLCILPC